MSRDHSIECELCGDLYGGIYGPKECRCWARLRRNYRKLFWDTLNLAANLLILSWFARGLPEGVWFNGTGVICWSAITLMEGHRDFVKEQP